MSGIDWMREMRPPCWRCGESSERDTRCGYLCTCCLSEYRNEYVEYKSAFPALVQRVLRKRFADKWFFGELDESHAWSIKQLDLTKRVPDFRQRYNFARRVS